MAQRIYILGAGVTGLAAARASGYPVYEAAAVPGGICSSYYMRPGGAERIYAAPADGEAYRFEIGGGHWIFGGDPAVLRLIRSLVPVRSYRRRAGVYFSAEGRYVPYPLQHHLRHLAPEVAAAALQEMMTPPRQAARTMDGWLRQHFGPTLCRLFFDPFHARYTGGLWQRIAPQDAYKSPVQPALVVRGALQETAAVGYNTTFLYPEAGLDALARRLAAAGTVHYDRRVVRVDTAARRLHLADGTVTDYDLLLSTLPLNRMHSLADLPVEAPADPYTSVLVLNIGAVRGAACPDHHWLYVPDSRAGFHRVGCYSNVDAAFLPASARARRDRVSLYVERAYPGGERPDAAATARYTADVVRELQAWGYIADVEAVDPTWIEVAYTWAWPDSPWRAQALARLEAEEILMVGRYGRWTFQGIADSIRDGLCAGASIHQQ